MRRRLVIFASGAVVILALLCAAGFGWAWSTRGRELVLPGATDVQIDRRGVFRLDVSYHFAAGTTLRDLTQHLTRAGWRRVRFPNAERETFSFVRASYSNRVREIVVLSVDPADRRLARLYVSRCVTLGSWFSCM